MPTTCDVLIRVEDFLLADQNGVETSSENCISSGSAILDPIHTLIQLEEIVGKYEKIMN